MQSEPAEIRPLSCEQTGDRFDEEGKGRSTSQTTRVPQRQDPFHPTIALLSACPLAPFAPQHAAAVGPLRDVICGFDTPHIQEYPQGLAFSCQMPGTRPGFIFTGGVLPQERWKRAYQARYCPTVGRSLPI
jgi:hypothetical protein